MSGCSQEVTKTFEPFGKYDRSDLMMLESAVMKKVKQIARSSRESVVGSKKLVECGMLWGVRARLCLGCMHTAGAVSRMYK